MNDLVNMDPARISEYLDTVVKTGTLLPAEKAMFINIAREFGLNPFKHEIYITAFGEGAYRQCSIIVGYEVYIKRAERSGKLDGWRVWTEGTGRELKAVIEIHRKDWKEPFRHEVFYEEVDKALVELPLPRARRLAQDYGLSQEQAELITEEKALADYFEKAVIAAEPLERADTVSRIVNWILSDLKHIMDRDHIAPEQLEHFRLDPRRLGELVVLLAEDKISQKNAKQVVDIVLTEDKDPVLIIHERGWEQIHDPRIIADAIRTVLNNEPAAISELKTTDNAKRKKTLTTYLVGKVLASTGGRADPKIVGQQLQEVLLT